MTTPALHCPSAPRSHLVAAATNARRVVLALVVLGLVVLLAGCARHYTAGASSDPYGFFSGLWHGIVFPYALLANVLSWLLSLIDVDFLSNIEVVGRPNTGVFFYYIGFALGLFAYGGGRAAAR